MKDRQTIFWHGTTKENAKIILEEGFNKYTFFAKDIKDSLWMFGKHRVYIFAVAFPFEKHKDFYNHPEAWQFVSQEHISPERIVGLWCIKISETIYLNEELRQSIFESNLEVMNQLKEL